MSPTENHVITMLQTAYRMEIETVTNYLANSVFLDGIDAMEVRRSLADDVAEELNHARMLAERIKQLGGRIPGSLELEFDQKSMQPPEDPREISSVIAGVIEAEQGAIDHYLAIIRATAGGDPVTADLATKILAEEEQHRILFEGFQSAALVRNSWNS
jgi:bacterioferritin